MELRRALEQRRMVRSFDGRPIDPHHLDSLCVEALRAPTAGNAAGVSMITIGADDVGAYIDVATDEQWRARSRRAAGLRRAGAVVLVTCDPTAYFERYGEDDKSASGLDDETNWPVPYWYTDAAMATMTLLLLVEEADWQATIWGNFRHEAQVLKWARVTAPRRLFASVLIGHGDGRDARSGSLDRVVPSRRDRVRRLDIE